MKKLCILFLPLFIIILTAIGITGNSGGEDSRQNEYLRIHIRANSNDSADQDVKYLVRDEIVEYLTPLVSTCKTKQEAIAMTDLYLGEISQRADEVLRANGFTYGAKASVKKEEFPTRIYGEYTLEAGEYDALIVELGEGTGDNWWCCIYPPFCFTAGNGNVIYRSAILETIAKFYR